MEPNDPVEKARRSGRWRHALFQVAVVVKGIDGVLELLGAVLLLVLGPGGIGDTVRFLTQHELAEDPHDLLARLLIRHTQQLGSATIHFAAAYLAVHGVLKVWLVGGLLRGRRWVFPVAMLFLGLFIAYQLFRLSHHPGAGLAFLTVLDVVILVLVWREYRALPKPS